MTAANYGEPVACMKRGYMRNVPGSSWAVGDSLWGTNGGSISVTRPDGPLPQVYIGTVFEDEGGGLYSVDVDVRILPSLGELSGVARETPANLDTLIYNSTTHAWTPRQIDHGGDIAGLLDDDHTQYLKEKASGGVAAEVPTHNHSSAAEAGTVDHGTATTAASLLDNDHPLYQRKHGFVVNTDGTKQLNLTYNKTTRKVTLTPVSSSFTFYIDGVQYIKSGAQESPAHAATTGKHYFYYDANGALQTSTTVWAIRDRAVTPVAEVYYYSGLSDGICFYECHTADRTLEQHYHDHFSEGTQLISGLALSGYTLNTDSDAGVTFAIASGVIADEDIVHSITGIADGGPYTVMYRTGAAGDWTWDSTPTLPFLGTTYPAWNNIDAGGAGVWGLTDLSGLALGKWANYYLIATPSVTAVTQLILIPGQTQYDTLAEAQGASISEIAWGTIPFEEVCPLYRLTFHARSTYGGTKLTQLQSVTAITAGGASVTQMSSPSVHNSLSNRDAAGTHPAASITFTPYDTLASTTVQAAIQELLDEATIDALDDVGDVNAAAPNNGDVLTWDSTPGEWIAAPPAATITELDDIPDVNAPAPNASDVLAWSGTEWVPVPASAPGAHAATHSGGSSDPVKLDDLAVPDDNTDLDVSIAAHGLCPKAPNDTSKFLRGDGTWATGSATVSSLDNVGDCNVPSPSNGDVLTWDSTPGEWVASPAPAGFTLAEALKAALGA